MPDYVTNRISGLLNTHQRAVNGTKVLLLGLTYKAGTSDWRESPSLAVASRLKALGADLRLCDPHLPTVADLGLDAPVVELSTEELRAADLVVVLVDHPEFEPALIAEHAELVFDAKAILRPHEFNGELL
jgi:UDP-N-acetyl-D-mannosaminuronate dehydrogenase